MKHRNTHISTGLTAKLAAVVCLFGVLLCPTAFGRMFSNQFIEFQLPFKWSCALEGAEWVCQSTDKTKKRDAIIVLAAKLKGDQDSLDKYQAYLTKPRTYVAPNGKSVVSKPKYAKIMQINGHPWVDAIHLDSEIPGFYTRYLATVKQDIGVLVTYSVRKDKYQEYLPQFEDMVKSLKVFRKAGGMNASANQSIFNSAQLPGSFTQKQVFPGSSKAALAKKKGKKKGGSLALYGVILAAAVAFIIIKKRRGRS